MEDVKVKICGITNADDALAAVRLGADYIGFNFYRKSPRYISTTAAAEIAVKLPATIGIIGVFVNENEANILSAVGNVRLTGVQLHGDETAQFAFNLSKALEIEIIRAYRIKPQDDPDRIEILQGITSLLDAHSAESYGGTGLTTDWAVAQKLAAKTRRTFLAGGLTAENVAKAIALVRPFAVDVCSSIESYPGRKDEAKMKRFIEAVKQQ